MTRNVPTAMKHQPCRWLYKPAILICLVLGPHALRAADQSLEYRVKAAFLLNFTKFIEWPPAAFGQPDSPISICILGEDPFGPALDQTVTGEVVNGRRVIVQRIKRAPSPGSCQVLFISRSERDVAAVLTGLGPGVLSIGEGEGFIHNGGMIGFVIENRRVRFGINEAAAENAGIKLSSKLLNVAATVER